MPLKRMLPALASILAAPLLGQSTLAYRGLEPGIPLVDFARAANRLAVADLLSCKTSARTAALMECGATITTGERRVQLSAFVIAGDVALVSVTDSGGPELVDRWRETLHRSWGPGTETARAMVQWVDGGRVARLTWRAGGDARWVAISIAHDATLARIEEFLESRTRRDP